MENVDLKVDGDKLVITVDLKPKGKLSSTGKTLLVASTRGATALSSYAKRKVKGERPGGDGFHAIVSR